MTATTKQTHTPGPWRVRENPNGTLGIDATERDGTTCQPARVNGDATDKIYGEETRANAALIAAAPDLLAALKDMLSRHLVVTPHGYEDPGGDFTRARAAVRKAEEGDTP